MSEQTQWRVVAVRSTRSARLDEFPDFARTITLSVASQSPVLVEAIERAAAAHGIELKRVSR